MRKPLDGIGSGCLSGRTPAAPIQWTPGGTNRPVDVRFVLLVSGFTKVGRETTTNAFIALVRKPRVDNEIVRYLDRNEEERLLSFAPEPLRSAIIVSIYSGLREGELLALTLGGRSALRAIARGRQEQESHSIGRSSESAKGEPTFVRVRECGHRWTLRPVQ